MQRDCVHACFPRDDHLSRQAYTYRGICVSEFEIDVLDKIRHTSSTLRLAQYVGHSLNTGKCPQECV